VHRRQSGLVVEPADERATGQARLARHPVDGERLAEVAQCHTRSSSSAPEGGWHQRGARLIS
jgi:hypothetical protein